MSLLFVGKHTFSHGIFIEKNPGDYVGRHQITNNCTKQARGAHMFWFKAGWDK